MPSSRRSAELGGVKHQSKRDPASIENIVKKFLLGIPGVDEERFSDSTFKIAMKNLVSEIRDKVISDRPAPTTAVNDETVMRDLKRLLATPTPYSYVALKDYNRNMTKTADNEDERQTKIRTPVLTSSYRRDPQQRNNNRHQRLSSEFDADSTQSAEGAVDQPELLNSDPIGVGGKYSALPRPFGPRPRIKTATLAAILDKPASDTYSSNYNVYPEIKDEYKDDEDPGYRILTLLESELRREIHRRLDGHIHTEVSGVSGSQQKSVDSISWASQKVYEPLFDFVEMNRFKEMMMVISPSHSGPGITKIPAPAPRDVLSYEEISDRSGAAFASLHSSSSNNNYTPRSSNSMPVPTNHGMSTGLDDTTLDSGLTNNLQPTGGSPTDLSQTAEDDELFSAVTASPTAASLNNRPSVLEYNSPQQHRVMDCCHPTEGEKRDSSPTFGENQKSATMEAPDSTPKPSAISPTFGSSHRFRAILGHHRDEAFCTRLYADVKNAHDSL